MENEVLQEFGMMFGGKGTTLRVKRIKKLLEERKNLDGDVYFTFNGKILASGRINEFDDDEDLCIRSHIRVPGGKGGFGSMLRAIGAQIEKTTNREACRDLSGRRMRDVNNEKAISDWLEKQKTQEEDKAKKKKEKLERILNPPKHVVSDSSYVNDIKENAEKVDDALKQGLQIKSSSHQKSSSNKRHHVTSEKKHAKKQKMWLEFDSDESFDENDDNNEGISDVASPVEEREPKEMHSSPGEKSFCGLNRNESPTAVDQQMAKEEHSEKNVKCDDIVKNGEQGKEVNRMEHDKKQSSSSQNGENVDKIDLQSASRAEDLEVYGLERLKSELIKHGLKCGGTLKQRAERLFMLKDTPIEKLDKSLFAKASKKLMKS